VKTRKQSRFDGSLLQISDVMLPIRNILARVIIILDYKKKYKLIYLFAVVTFPNTNSKIYFLQDNNEK